MSIESDTTADLGSRIVSLGNFGVGVQYPSAKDPAETKVWEALSLKLLPAYPSSLALDRVLAYLEKDVVKARQTAVVMQPPPILVSTRPAVLVIVDGEPLQVDI